MCYRQSLESFATSISDTFTNSKDRQWLLEQALLWAGDQRTSKAPDNQEVPETSDGSPNRLRHTAATEVRKEFGLEGAQIILGHASADVSQVYAERDIAKGLEIARRIG
jgi:integrase